MDKKNGAKKKSIYHLPTSQNMSGTDNNKGIDAMWR